jgi:hypothetical protein
VGLAAAAAVGGGRCAVKAPRFTHGCPAGGGRRVEAMCVADSGTAGTARLGFCMLEHTVAVRFVHGAIALCAVAVRWDSVLERRCGAAAAMACAWFMLSLFRVCRCVLGQHAGAAVRSGGGGLSLVRLVGHRGPKPLSYEALSS